MAFDQEGRNEAEWQEEIAMCDEHLLEGYLSGNPIEENQIREMIRARKLFPCYFGSALKGQGVEELLEGIHAYARCWEKDGEKEGLGARVYKISRDEQGNRLTHLKILFLENRGKKRSTRSGSILEVNMRRSARRNRAVSVQ